MRSNGFRERARGLVDDAGTSAPTPLFVAFLAALAIAALFAYRSGPSAAATFDFIVIAVSITVAALLTYGALALWSIRAGHRAASLSAARPGAVVARGSRVAGLALALRALRAESPLVPFGLTLVADDLGIELWSGAAEHPVRIGRVPWDLVEAVRVTHVTRFGRCADGVTVTVRRAPDAATIELPFAVTGSGLMGLFTPPRAELEQLVASLEERRAAAAASAARYA